MFKFDPNSTEKQGRWRLRSPSEFSRMWTRHDLQDKGISYIVGLLRTSEKTTKLAVKKAPFAIQSIRFDKSLWTEKKAAGWWKKNKNRFKKYWTEEDWKLRWKEPKRKPAQPQKRVSHLSLQTSAKPKYKVVRRKNPNIDIQYQQLLTSAFYGYSVFLSRALAYYQMGNECDTCNLSYRLCKCEGKREHEFDPKGQVIQGSCEQCDKYYCLCDYDIFDEEGIVDEEKLIREVWELAKRTLDDNLFYLFVWESYLRLKNDITKRIPINKIHKHFYNIVNKMKESKFKKSEFIEYFRKLKL